MNEIIEEFEDFCASLAISGDSPKAETIKEYFDRYAQSLQLQQTGVNKRFYCQDEFYEKKEKCDKQCITCFSKE